MNNKTILAIAVVVLGFFIILGVTQLGGPTGAAVAGNGGDYCYGTLSPCYLYSQTNEFTCISHYQQVDGEYAQCGWNDGECYHAYYPCIIPIPKDMVFIDDIKCKEWNLCFTGFREEVTETHVEGKIIYQEHQVPYANVYCVKAAYESMSDKTLVLPQSVEDAVPIPPQCVEEKDPSISTVTFVTEIREEVNICTGDFVYDCGADCDPSNCGACLSYMPDSCAGGWCLVAQCTGPVMNNGPECVIGQEQCYPIGLLD